MVLFQGHKGMKKEMIFIPYIISVPSKPGCVLYMVSMVLVCIRRKKKTRRKKTSIGNSEKNMRSGMNIEYAMKKEPRERNFRKE
jgi:hypothetical protein